MDGLEWETPAGKMDAVYPGSSASVPFPTLCTGVQVRRVHCFNYSQSSWCNINNTSELEGKY